MDNVKIVSKFLASQGLRLAQGKSLEPLLPYLMLDVQYQIICKVIKPLKCRFELNQIRKKWLRCYTAFNQEFFRPFNADERDEIIDAMSDFEDYINTDMMLAKVAIMDCASGYTLDEQNVLASCLLCNILSQSAGIIVTNVYKGTRWYAFAMHEIEAMRHYSNAFIRIYCKNGDSIDCNQSERVRTTVDALCHKMIKWLYITTPQ